MSTIHDYAREIADERAGATLDQLLANLAAATKDLENWHLIHRAALDSLASQPYALAPPLSITEAAKALNCGRSKVYELIQQGHLSSIKQMGGIIRIPRADVARLQEGRAA